MAVDKHALGHLRQIQLSPFEIKTLDMVSKLGGEISWYPERVKPEVNRGIDLMRQKQLLDLINPAGQALDGDVASHVSSLVAQYGTRFRLRLTDQGRSVQAQLDAMSAKPKLEVQSAS